MSPNVDAELFNRQQPQGEDYGGEQNGEASRADTFRQQQQEARRAQGDAQSPKKGTLSSVAQAASTPSETVSTVKKAARLWKILSVLGVVLFNPISAFIAVALISMVALRGFCESHSVLGYIFCK
jgi:hypothetical protein